VDKQGISVPMGHTAYDFLGTTAILSIYFVSGEPVLTDAVLSRSAEHEEEG